MERGIRILTILLSILSLTSIPVMVPLSIICAVCILFTYSSSLLLRRFYRQKVAEDTVDTQIAFAGVSRRDAKKIRGTAVICGGR